MSFLNPDSLRCDLTKGCWMTGRMVVPEGYVMRRLDLEEWPEGGYGEFAGSDVREVQDWNAIPSL
jgi:hypothetical protein